MTATRVVAGGAGFIGSHLCERLLARGDRVVCIDDFSTGVRANVEHLLADGSFTLVDGDVIDPDTLGALGEMPVDTVFHLASPASPPAYLARPFETLRVGSIGTLNLLDLAHRRRARFVLASTSEVYGDPLEHPQTESYNGNVDPVGERAVYDEAKRFAEAATAAAQRTWGVDIGIARIFNTYGPRLRADDGRVVSNFIVQALAGRDLTIYGDGTQTRSFCYVDDLVGGLIALGDSSENRPVNLGNPDEYSLLELATIVRDLVGVEVGAVHGPLPSGDPRVRRPDIGRAIEVLGWRPVTTLRDGLEATIAWMTEHHRSSAG